MRVGSRSYYAWQKRSKPTKNRKSSNLEDKIKAIYFDKKQRYGSPRITAELLDDGIKVSRNTGVNPPKNSYDY
jgi:hypothetical protein